MHFTLFSSLFLPLTLLSTTVIQSASAVAVPAAAPYPKHILAVRDDVCPQVPPTAQGRKIDFSFLGAVSVTGYWDPVSFHLCLDGWLIASLIHAGHCDGTLKFDTPFECDLDAGKVFKGSITLYFNDQQELHCHVVGTTAGIFHYDKDFKIPGFGTGETDIDGWTPEQIEAFVFQHQPLPGVGSFDADGVPVGTPPGATLIGTAVSSALTSPTPSVQPVTGNDPSDGFAVARF